MSGAENTLIVITGPTGVGKSAVAMQVAQALGTEIISADSRQIYAGIPITTAAPTPRMMAQVPHHLVGTLSLDSYYSASMFEMEALSLCEEVFGRCNGVAVVCGGSMMYVDALCNGLDELPTITPEVRDYVQVQSRERGEEATLRWLQEIDPVCAASIDAKNTKRIVHAIEISLQAGVPYSSLIGKAKPKRPFRILKCMIEAPREVLFERINMRTLAMVDAGMLQEVRSVAHLRELNSLNTVGFKEMFRYLDGEWSLDQAIARMQKNTRVYAKKQITWYAKDTDIIRMSGDTDSCTTQILNMLK